MNNTGNNHILVVDDEQEMLVNYNRILSRAGYSVKTVLSGNDPMSRTPRWRTVAGVPHKLPAT